MARFRDSMLAGWPGLTAIIWLAAIIDSPIHWIWLAGLGWLGWAGWLAGRLAGWLAGYFIDFHRFLTISYDFMDFRGPSFAACGGLCKRNDAPIETFTRF